jgi:membrane-associated phospholipid phosphatase
LITFALVGYLGVIGYSIFPVIGPHAYFSDIYDKELYGYSKKAAIDLTQEKKDRELTFYKIAMLISSKESFGGSIPRNCFPSLHTAWGVIVLVFAFMYLRWLFYIILIPDVSMIIATIYLRFHYFIDLVGGVMLAIFVITVVPKLEELWERHSPEILKQHPF